MCGIVGYIGDKNCVPILIEGLGRLEYRGYDSAGLVVRNENGDLVVRKRVGKLANLKSSLDESPLEGTAGVGHTRWATHGPPSKTNSHPHTDCSGDIALVHNGIIENYLELRNELEAAGHVFKSETDTEVVAHLVEKEFQNGASNLVEAVRNALKNARGAYAIGVVRRQEPGVLVAARFGSPLIVGFGEGETFIASDVPAILNRTRHVIYPDDGEVLEITRDRCKICDLDGNPVEHEQCVIEWNQEAAEKGGYETFMLKEIHEQPQVIRDTLLGNINSAKTDINLDPGEFDIDCLKRARQVYIVACGTAYHAGLVGKYLIENYTGMRAETILASEFRYAEPKVMDDTIIIPITQSGETADTLGSIQAAREKNSSCYVLSICNVVGSTIARESDAVLYTHAGLEIGVASTKAYTSQLTALNLLTIFLARLRGEMDDNTAGEYIRELEAIPNKLGRILEKEQQLADIARKYHQARNALYLGRGLNYPSALEGALKNKEISYMHAEGYAAGEMKHGPIALIDWGFMVVCIATKGPTYEKMLSNMKEVGARNGKIAAIATEGDQFISQVTNDVIYVPEVPEILSPIVNAIPMQLLAYYIARERGCDIDKPRNLAKSVTVE